MFKIAAANKDCYIRGVYLWIDIYKNLYAMARTLDALANLKNFLGFFRSTQDERVASLAIESGTTDHPQFKRHFSASPIPCCSKHNHPLPFSASLAAHLRKKLGINAAFIRDNRSYSRL